MKSIYKPEANINQSEQNPYQYEIIRDHKVIWSFFSASGIYGHELCKDLNATATQPADLFSYRLVK